MTTIASKLSLATLALMAAAGAQAGCYTILNAKGDIVSQTSTPPVDMARQLDQTVPQRFGAGADMVFGIADADCGPPAEPYEAQLTPVVSQSAAPARASARRTLRRAPKADRG